VKPGDTAVIRRGIIRNLMMHQDFMLLRDIVVQVTKAGPGGVEWKAHGSPFWVADPKRARPVFVVPLDDFVPKFPIRYLKWAGSKGWQKEIPGDKQASE